MKFTAINAYIRKKKERSQINHLNLHTEELEKKKSKVGRRKETINIRAERTDVASDPIPSVSHC